jgi:hypothetical protein
MGVGKPLPELRLEISNMVAYKLSTEISYKFGVQVPRAQRNPCNWIQRIRTPMGRIHQNRIQTDQWLWNVPGAREPRAHATGLQTHPISLYLRCQVWRSTKMSLGCRRTSDPKGRYTQVVSMEAVRLGFILAEWMVYKYVQRCRKRLLIW